MSGMWRTHSCVPRRDSSRRLGPGIDTSVDAARRGRAPRNALRWRRVVGFALFSVATLAMSDTPPITDETLRMSALHAIFPGTQITLVPGKRIGDPSPKKTGPREDALARENVYRVIGKARNEAEKCAAGQVISGKPSSVRLVRLQAFHWPKSAGLLAVLQYAFEDANPAMACPSIGLLAQLANTDGTWQVGDQYLLETVHHFSLPTIRMLDLTGDGVDELVVESDFGGAETWGTNITVFDLTHAKFEELFSADSRISFSTDDEYKQILDVPKTIQQRGERFCFTKTTMVEATETFRPPRITKPCYRSDKGEYHEEAEERNKQLAPFPKP
jgi:hypothetical protein